MDKVIEHLRKVCEHYEKGICTKQEFVMEIQFILDDAKRELEHG